MRKLAIAGVVLLLLVVGLVGFGAMHLNTFINENRGQIEAEAATALGRDVTFSEFGLSFRRGLAIGIRDLKIADDPAFAEDNFVEAGNVDVRVKLLPLLTGNVEVRRIMLDNPVVNVIRTRDGLNVSTFGATGPQAKPQPSSDDAKSGGVPQSGGTAALAVALFDLLDGTVRYVDRTVNPPAEIVVDNLDLKATDLDPTSPMEFNIAAAVLGAERQNFSMVGTVGPVETTAANETKLNVRVELDGVTVDELTRVPMIRDGLPPELAVSGPMTMTAIANGTLADVALNTVVDMSEAAVDYGTSFAKKKGVPLKLDVELDRAGNEVRIRDGQFTLNEAVLNAKGTVKTGNTTSYALDLSTDSVPLSGWDELLPALAGLTLRGSFDSNLKLTGSTGSKGLPQINGTSVLKNVSASGEGFPPLTGLSTTATFKGGGMSLAPADFTVGGAPVHLEADVSDLATAATKFLLTSPSLALAVLGAGADDAKRDEVLNDVRLAGHYKSTSAGPEVTAKITTKAGVVRDIDIRDLSANLRYSAGKAAFDSMTVALFGGTFQGDATYDTKSSDGQPAFDFDGNLRDVQIPDVFAWAGVPASRAVLEGVFDGDLSLNGRGSEWSVIQQLLSGTGRIDIRDGMLKDVSLADTVLTRVTGMPALANLISPKLRAKYPKVFSTGSTPFDALKAGIRVADGKILTDDLLFSAADFAINARGGIGLDKSVDLNAALKTSAKLTKDLIGEVDAVKYLAGSDGRVEIPFRLTGNFPSVQATPDASVLGLALKRAVAGNIGDLIGEALGGKKRREATEGDNSAETEPREKTDARDVIGNILGGVLGGNQQRRAEPETGGADEVPENEDAQPDEPADSEPEEEEEKKPDLRDVLDGFGIKVK